MQPNHNKNLSLTKTKMKNSIKLGVLLAGFALSTNLALAFDADLTINQADIRFSVGEFLEGKTTRIYASVTNLSGDDILGVVRFYDNGKQIGGDQAISIFGNKTDDIFIDWTPGPGQHKIAVKIFPWEPKEDNPANNWITSEVFVAQDTDRDGITNSKDEDDDGDGVADEKDPFPLNGKEWEDTDGDGVGNNQDEDDDNDDVPDKFDDMPLDPNETMDTDKDGIGNIKDDDDDGDGLKDNEEENLKTDPANPDSDGDGTKDGQDAFPLDPKEAFDTDKDGIGNSIDTDDDNDSIADDKDEFPLNKEPVIELKDLDLKLDVREEFTFDATPSYDKDGKIVSYIWEINGKVVQEGNFLNYRFAQPGNYDVKLTVMDSAGQSKSENYQVNVANLSLYKQLLSSLGVVLLAMLIFFKYIFGAKKSKQVKK